MRKILWFKEITKNDIAQVGGKGANLGEMYNLGIPVPNGFCVTSGAYYDFLEKTALRQKIITELKGLNVENSKKLLRASENIKRAILAGKMPKDTAKLIITAYQKLSGTHDQKVAVRSSATAEDLPEASFAGQQSTFVNIKGRKDVVSAVQKCWASLFEPRAIFYRADKGFDHMKVGIAVPVQLMVDSAVSGVMFSINPLTNNNNEIAIEAILGLGEGIVSGQITPDQYSVRKDTGQIIAKNIVVQDTKIVGHGKNKKVGQEAGKAQKIEDKHLLALAQYAIKLENHYKKPQDIEWAYDNNRVYIVQTRPVTTFAQTEKASAFKITEKEAGRHRLLLDGISASPGVGFGKVRVIKDASEIGKIIKGDVLVTAMTTPDFVPAMKRAAAIVTNEGGQTCHAAIVSRELGIPCVVGTTNATTMLKTGEEITIDGSNGRVYSGILKTEKSPEVKDPKPGTRVKTATKLYVNLGEPSQAATVSQMDTDGVGLLRAEFMMAEIGEHPRAMIAARREKEMVKKLEEGLLTFCRAFTPRPVVYRTNDFKTNEYRALKGGEKYETIEANPLIGFRGAGRYVEDSKVFALELEAIKRVRNKHGFKNLHLMLPFVRTVEELVECKKIISAHGLRRSVSFNLWMMVEVPSNVIMLEEFLKAGIDGLSIGSNDLTMLILGLDRDNPRVANTFDEQDEAVLWALEKTIKTAIKNKVTVSICGQAPTTYPALSKKLVGWGITSVSVSPDALNRTRQIIVEAEKEILS
ncbi:MAG: phosphoenolpyruvate synthase [bacterium]